MKNKRYIINLAMLTIVALLLASCKKYLDIKPKGYTIPQTIEDYEKLLNAEILLKTMVTDMEQLSDDFYNPAIQPGGTSPKYRLYNWLPNPYVLTNDIKNSLWNVMYANIFQYNVVINEVDGATGGNDIRKKIAKARARVGRAAMNFSLTIHFTKPYNAQTADRDMGLPLVKSPSLLDEIPARASVSDTYDFMIKDIEESLENLPETSENNFEIDREAAYGWLARIYLTMNNYEKAAAAANSALEITKSLQDFNELYLVNTAADSSTHYVADFSSNVPKTYFDLAQNVESLQVVTYEYPRGMYAAYLSKAAAALFDAKDLRQILVVPSYYYEEKDNDINAVQSWDGRYVYFGKGSFSYSIGPTVPEMYLIRAEGAARAGNISAAMVDLNTLRKNRFRPEDYTDFTASTKKEAIKLVLDERRRELLFKGGLRWADMRRLNNDPDFGFTAIHEVKDQPDIKLEPNSPRYAVSIPPTAAIGNVVQNP